MESAIFRLKSSLEGVNQNNPLILAQGEFSVDCPRTTNQIS